MTPMSRSPANSHLGLRRIEVVPDLAEAFGLPIARNAELVPSIFRAKFEAVRELFRGAPIHGRALYSRAGEGEIAGALDETVAAFPGVDVGSYPHLEAADYRVKITLDGRDRAAVDRALAFLAGRLGEAVVRTD